MTRGSSLFGVCLLASAATIVASQRPEFRAGTHTVSIYATVLGSDGRLVTGLTRDDFEVYDNGVRQPITVFASDPQPISIVTMIDRSGSVHDRFELVRAAAREFVLQLRPEDRARIGSFSERVEIHPDAFTSDREVLLEILDHRLQDAGPTPLWNATAAAIDALAGEEGRRVVLVFTDGHDTPGVGTNTSLEELHRRSVAEDVMVYAIGLTTERCGLAAGGGLPGPAGPRFQGGPRRPTRPGFPGSGGTIQLPRPRIPPILPPIGFPPRGPSGPPPPVMACQEARPDPGLRELASVGGGGYFELDTADDLVDTFARVAHELHQQYLLAFTAAALDDTVHTLDVRVSAPRTEVRARQHYLASASRTPD